MGYLEVCRSDVHQTRKLWGGISRLHWGQIMTCIGLWQSLSRLDNQLQRKAHPIIVACQWKRSSGDVGPANSEEHLHTFQKAQGNHIHQ